MITLKLFQHAFSDRDGVLNAGTHYAHRSDQIEWIDGALEVVSRLNRVDYRVFIVTTQFGIARGLFDGGSLDTFVSGLIFKANC